MALTANVVADTPITSTWGNTIRDRTVQNFASAAERASQWTSPPTGAYSYLVDDPGMLWVYAAGTWTYANAGGILAYGTGTGLTGIGATHVDLPGMTVTVTVPAGRRIRVVASGLYQSGANPVTPWLGICNSGGTVLNSCAAPIYAAANSGSAHVELHATPGAGSQTWKAMGWTEGDLTNLVVDATRTAFLYAEDVGPA